MFVKVVKNNKGRPNTSFISIVESYREDGKVKHRTIRNLGLFDDLILYLKTDSHIGCPF